MNETTQAAIREAAAGSAEGRLHFAQVIGLLAEAGVESYVADYRARRTTYYLPDGQTLDVSLHMPEIAIAEDFDAPALQAAIRGSQRGEVKYPEFKRLSCNAGCVRYTVWITGRQVTYLGRRGESHVEKFPD
jgi:uncharacterized protein YbcV (DUF1398 family)